MTDQVVTCYIYQEGYTSCPFLLYGRYTGNALNALTLCLEISKGYIKDFGIIAFKANFGLEFQFNEQTWGCQLQVMCQAGVRTVRS